MTRAEWIQQTISRVIAQCSTVSTGDISITAVVEAANALEKSGDAPWDGPLPAAAQINLLIDEAVQVEREACAKLVREGPWLLADIACEIRARGAK
jgi:hypothetical protein